MDTDISPFSIPLAKQDLGAGFSNRVLARVEAQRIPYQRRERIIRTTILVLSLAISIGMVFIVSHAIATSDLGPYLPLLISDGVRALTYWNALGISVFGSLPLVGIGFTLGFFGVFLWSVYRLTRPNLWRRSRFNVPKDTQ